MGCRAGSGDFRPPFGDFPRIRSAAHGRVNAAGLFTRAGKRYTRGPTVREKRLAEENAEDKTETKKTIRTFAVASFLNDMGSDIIYPIWPLFVTQVLKANMAALGFLDGLGEALVSISQALSGYWSDRIRKRKIFIWIGYLCGGFSRLCF